MTAAIAAWLLPGLGHYMIGEKRRGSIIGATIGIIWLAGLLISGISVIDRREHPAWFLGQMLLAPSVAVNVGHQFIDANYKEPVPNPADPADAPIYEPSFGHVYEQGMLYTLLAGLLNLLAILDVLCPASPQRREARAAGGADEQAHEARSAAGSHLGDVK
jgi:hypothetical protein